MKPRIAIVGPGRVGQSIGKLLCAAGYPLSAVVGRNAVATRTGADFIGAGLMATTHLQRCHAADVIFLTVPDDALSTVAHDLACVDLRPGTLVVHCSGLHTTDILADFDSGKHAVYTLSLHPLQTFASPAAGSAALPGSYCSLQGNKNAVERGFAIVADLGCRGFVLDAAQKTRYHAAACMVSNYVTTLIDAATALCADIPDADEFFPAAFRPLIEAGVRNSIEVGTEQALTGPIVRGDSGTLAKHVQEIEHSRPDMFPLYRVLAQQTLEIALRAGRLDPDSISVTQMRAILDRT
ncbi:MAG: Rossmann-like and DUF2520 domain-containing protein [Desulfuromonadaceae bacterium]